MSHRDEQAAGRLVQETLQRLPELRAEARDRDLPTHATSDYGFFADVFVPYLKRLLRDDKSHVEELRRAFSQIELLCQDADPEIRNLVCIPVLEELMADPESLIVTAARYIGPCAEEAYYELGIHLRLPPQSLAYWRGDTEELDEVG